MATTFTGFVWTQALSKVLKVLFQRHGKLDRLGARPVGVPDTWSDLEGTDDCWEEVEVTYMTGPGGCVTKEMKGKRQGHSLGRGMEAGFSSSRQA